MTVRFVTWYVLNAELGPLPICDLKPITFLSTSDLLVGRLLADLLTEN